jgi:hypothetical protein
MDGAVPPASNASNADMRAGHTDGQAPQTTPPRASRRSPGQAVAPDAQRRHGRPRAVARVLDARHGRIDWLILGCITLLVVSALVDLALVFVADSRWFP